MLHGTPGRRHRALQPRQLRIGRQYRRIVSGKERERRQHIARPANTGHLRDYRRLVGKLAGQHQVCPAAVFNGSAQLFIALPDRRKQHLAQRALRPLVDVHQLGDLLRIFGVERRPDLHKLETQRLNLRPKNLRHRHHRHMPAPSHLQSDTDQRVHIPQSPKCSENDPHVQTAGYRT